ncbi:alpha-2-macroglobulin family protein [Fulvivirga ligni]|uniref:alpha-2-macroglobulin family protein n=1 Tax=Fulvivirga ligni TaxID=2904246 RepID=UPI001F40FAC1|nr:MG2 domain-containing protein [Fulvivirga ligni]UII21103.1 MG2 domain-containing protein [Fulvivirga ligni]
MAQKNTTRIILGGVFTLALIIAGIVYFTNNSKAEVTQEEQINPAFSAYISSYTAGVVTSNSPIRIRLVASVADSSQVGKPVDADLFDFEPSIKGEATWIDANTVEFIPAERMTSGITYTVNFYLSKLMEVADDLKTFTYQFQVVQQNYDLTVENIETVEGTKLTKQNIIGVVYTADYADDEKVEKLIEAVQDGAQLPVKWQHTENEHHFVISEVTRKDVESQVKISMHGDAIGVDKDDEEMVDIPALGDFSVLDIKVVQSPTQYVVVQFSDPLKPKQNLDGLITIEGLSSLDFDIKENQVYVYPPARQAGTKKVIVSSGIRNILDYRMSKSETHQVTFAQLSPAVRVKGKGSILPSSDGLVFPFEAVSLKAVDVEVIQIFESNIIQFLQTNDLGGNQYLRRVGKPVLRKTVALNTSGVVDLGKWNRFTLDISELIKTEPGAIYQIRISFRKYQSVYFCGESAAEEDMKPLEEQDWTEDEDKFDAWDSYRSYRYNSDYRWEERENPCHVSYYLAQSPVTKNILASDLGMIAKRGNSGELQVAVTDLRTTEPKAGVRIDAYNFQQQVISSAITDADGKVYINDLKESPFVVVATDNKQKGYLKLDDGSSLSLSNFNVSGSKIQEGLKGFIYGERGVWRPGDTLHLTFVLEDEQKKIPETHPIIMELYDPSWQLVNKVVKAQGENGFYDFKMITDPEAPTGNWTAKVKVGGAEFSQRVKIETVKPNRLKIKLDFGTEKITAGDNQFTGDLEVSWLHGAPARNLKAEFEMLLAPTTTKFEKYPAYTFDDPARDFSSESKKIFEGYVDDEGKATVNANLSTENQAPGALKAYFTGKVFEEGGNFSIDNFSLPYYPYESFIGMKLPESKRWSRLFYDKTNQLDVVTVDANGKPVSRNDLEVEVYRLEWRWWWNQEDESLANYISRSSMTPIVRGKLSTVNGKGTYSFDLNNWGRYYIRVCDPVSGHCTGEVHYTSWGGSRDDMPGGATMLSFTADKEKYQVGEEVTIKIPSSNKGRALISIENGSRVLESYWIQTQNGETTFSFEATKDMAPNVYVFVTLLQEHKQTVNDLPIRLYGVVSLGVEDPNTILKPEIKMADVLAPGEEVSITISEKSQKKMTYTVAVVDEGLLDLTHFKTPNPWNTFYAREALGVKTWDLFDDVMGAYGGKVERLLAIGGDEEGTKNATAKANRFKPVVKYLGPFTIDKGDSKTHKFTMPQYVGSVKTMVVAGNQGAYGSAEKATPVRQPLMVLATLPRVLGPEEVVKLPVTVFAMEKSVKNVKVQVKANDMLEIVGPSSKNVTFSDIGDQVVYFDIKVKSKLGIGKVEVNATSGGEKAHDNIELDVRNPNPPLTAVLDELVQDGQSWNTNFEVVGMPGTNMATLEVSNLPPLNLKKRLSYLLRYPYGCVEQTTSSVFPQLYLSDLVELDDKQKLEVERNVRAGIERLKRFQRSDGGFSYWPGADDSNSWGSSYAGHFLIEAEKKGYNVPTNMIRQWKRYQRRKAAEWRRTTNGYYNSTLMQAYRLYTLAIAGVPESGAMNRLREEGNLDINSSWRLAAAYVRAGQKEAAQKLVEGLTTDVKDYRELGYTYGSGLRDEAMILETLTLLGEKKKAFSVLQSISKRMSAASYYMSTQTTAYCLIAIGQYVGIDGIANKELKYTYTLNGKTMKVSTDMPVAQSELDANELNSNSFKIQNTSDAVLYARIILEGTPVRGNEKATANNLKVKVSYVNTKGEFIDPATLEQGQDFVAEVTVTNPGLKGRYQNLALSQIFPSGWEIHNTRLNDMEQFNSKDVPDYQDIRDDRVYTYFDLNRNESKTFRVLLNASYQGTYYLPAVSCEAMYDNDISANTEGKEVRVLKAGGGS